MQVNKELQYTAEQRNRLGRSEFMQTYSISMNTTLFAFPKDPIKLAHPNVEHLTNSSTSRVCANTLSDRALPNNNQSGWGNPRSLSVFRSWGHDVTCRRTLSQATSHIPSSPRASKVAILHLVSNCPDQEVLELKDRSSHEQPLPALWWRLDLTQANQGELQTSEASPASVPDSITSATKLKKTRRFQAEVRQCAHWAAWWKRPQVRRGGRV